MVKVDAKGFEEKEIRALLEVMVSNAVTDEEMFGRQMTQTTSQCRARLPAKVVDSKKFKGEENLVTFAYKSASSITISSGAVFVDASQAMLVKVLRCYEVMINDKMITPLPEGAQAWGRAMAHLSEFGITSQFLHENQTGEKDGPCVKLEEQQLFVPREEEYHAAIAELRGETSRRLHNFPIWKAKLLQKCC